METSSNRILIGAVMLLVLIIGFGFVIWLGSVQREYDEYDVIFEERVSGLSVGGAVLFSGIKVGEVRSLKLAPNEPTKVVARVRVTKDTPVKTDTEAELELSGITGLAVIQFTGGTSEAALLKQIYRGRGAPLIEARLSELAKLLEGGGSIVENAQLLMSKDNIELISGIIGDVKVLSGAVAEKDTEIKSIIENAHSASADVASLTARLEASSQKIETLLITMDELLKGDAGDTLENFAATAEDASAVIKEVRSLLDDNRAAIDAFAQQGLGQTSAAMADIRRLVQTTDGILRELERDPAKFFFGEGRPERKR